MTRWLRVSTAADLPLGPFLDATDGNSVEAALTLTQPDIRLKKNGGNWAQKNAAQTLTHEENGYYEVSLDATDTNTLGLLKVHCHEAGALPVWDDYLVVPGSIYDGMVLGTLAVPGSGAPPATGSIGDFLAYLYKAWKHRKDQTATAYKLYNAAGSVVEQKAVVSDDATTFAQETIVSGP